MEEVGKKGGVPGQGQLCENGAAQLDCLQHHSTLLCYSASVHHCWTVQSCVTVLCREKLLCFLQYSVLQCLWSPCSAVETVHWCAARWTHRVHCTLETSRPARYRAGARRGPKGVQNNQTNLSALLCSADTHSSKNIFLLDMIPSLG